MKEQLKRSVGGHLIEETFSDGVIDCLEPPNYQEIFNAYKVASADKKIDALEATFEKCGYGFDPEVNRR